MMKLEDKLYTSTEVADILGVSLRSVYRYLDEGKIQADVKTATGRHRFSKQNILDFLHPQGGSSDASQEDVRDRVPAERVERAEPRAKIAPEVAPRQAPKQEVPQQPVMQDEETEEEPIDWLSKFREARAKFMETQQKEEEADFKGFADMKQNPEVKPVQEDKAYFYYRSALGGLKDIAQNIDKSAKNAGIEYAFTMNAGLSLYKVTRPFSLLHAYIRHEDKDFFERMLQLSPSDKSNAQISLICTDDDNIFDSKKEVYNLNVVADEQLRNDLLDAGEEALVAEFDSVVNA